LRNRLQRDSVRPAARCKRATRELLCRILPESISPSLSVVPPKQKQDAAVAKKPARDQRKFLRKAMHKRVFVNPAIKMFTPAPKLLKAHVTRRDPFKQSPACSEFRSEPCNFLDWDLVGEQ